MEWMCVFVDCDFWQEFWVGNEELVNIYEKRLADAGYISFKLARTNNRGDGKLFCLSTSICLSIRFCYCLRPLFLFWPSGLPC